MKTRLGLHTIRRRTDAFRRKARREASMEIRVFLAVWGSIERYWKKFFLGVFAFRQSLF
jgi:hypothetical protein